MDPNSNAQNLGIKMDDTKPIGCEKCGTQVFMNVTLLRRISPLVSPTGKEAMVPIQSFACIKCNHVNENFLPKGLRPDDIKPIAQLMTDKNNGK